VGAKKGRFGWEINIRHKNHCEKFSSCGSLKFNLVEKYLLVHHRRPRGSSVMHSLALLELGDVAMAEILSRKSSSKDFVPDAQ
jgi:hypothetical protein